MTPEVQHGEDKARPKRLNLHVPGLAFVCMHAVFTVVHNLPRPAERHPRLLKPLEIHQALSGPEEVAGGPAIARL